MTSGFNEIRLEENGIKIVFLTFREKLTRGDYALFVPQLENLMDKEGTIRVLVEFQDFQGWTIGALWEDTKFGAKHFNDIDRLAVVGDREWEKYLATFIKPFTKATVRYYDKSEKEEAKSWLREKTKE
jgi:hypothetical protein